MAETCKIPSGMVEFETSVGQKFSVELLAFQQELEKMVEAEAKKEGGGDHYEYLRAIVDRVQELRPGVLLTLGEADWLKDQVPSLVCAKKKKQADGIKLLLNSAGSMAFGAEDSAPKN